MRTNNFIWILHIVFLLGITSCSDDDSTEIEQIQDSKTYDFQRNGESTIAFEGQTTRIQMSEDLLKSLLNPELTKQQLLSKFAHQENELNFDAAKLNTSNKNIRSKVAASRDYFETNVTLATQIKQDFDAWIATQSEQVFPNWTIEAQKGSAGYVQEAGGGTKRYIDNKGLEIYQLFNKALIGALMLDQIVNNYLSKSVLDQGTNRSDNSNTVLVNGKQYTNMEHKWDEAFGYLYGTAKNPSNPNATIGEDDSFLNKYIGVVNGDSDFDTIAANIFDAFRAGRQAIIDKNYTLRDQHADQIRIQLSKVVAIRAVYYLQQGKILLQEDLVDYATLFHDLSEAIGFVYSLQFTRNPNTDSPYLNAVQIQSMIDSLTESEFGLWNVDTESLDKASETIAAAFNFSVDQAKN